MIVIVGESASGKSTVEKILSSTYGFESVTSCTTREPRENEINGIDYFFLTELEFRDKVENDEFVESAVYNSWHYGSLKSQYKPNSVAVMTPHGLRQLKKKLDIPIFAVYINVPRRDRLIKILQRGDNIEEAYRRNVSDVGQFDGIEDEVDLIVDNAGYEKLPMSIASYIYTKYGYFMRKLEVGNE